MGARILFTADSQIDERHRLDEHDRVMDFIASEAQRRGCNLTLHGGDIYERRSTERERRSVREWVERMASLGDVVICGGNHEAAGEVAEIEESATEAVAGITWACEAPRAIAPNSLPASVIVAVLPWPRREHLRAWLLSRGLTLGPEDASRTATEMLRDILRDFARRFDEMDPSGKLPRVLLAHVEIAGYVSDSDQPAVGSGMAVSVEDLMLAGADVVLCGHVHRPQEWIGTRLDGVSVPVIYAGSPRRTAYAAGELIEKGVVVVEFDGRVPKWHRVPTPATPMILVESRFVPEALTDPGLVMWDGAREIEDPRGAEIRFRYEVRADFREAAAERAERVRQFLLARGALEVRVEPVILPTTRARAPEVAAAVGVEQQLRAMWTTQDVPAARQDTLAQIARQIEESVR